MNTIFQQLCINGDIDNAKKVYGKFDITLNNEEYAELYTNCSERYIETFKFLNSIRDTKRIRSTVDNVDTTKKILMSTFQKLCKEGDVENVKKMYENFDIDLMYDDNNALWVACSKGYIELVKYLHSIMTPEQVAKYENSEIIWSCDEGHDELTEYLCSILSINAIMHDNYYVFMSSCRYGLINTVKYLSHKLPEQDLKKCAAEALRFACCNGQLKVVQYLQSIFDQEFVSCIFKEQLTRVVWNNEQEMFYHICNVLDENKVTFDAKEIIKICCIAERRTSIITFLCNKYGIGKDEVAHIADMVEQGDRNSDDNSDEE